MNDLPPPLVLNDRRKIDADQLKLLAIFHFVGAGLALVAMLFLAAHFTFMHLLFANPKLWEGQKSAPPAEFFAIFQWFYFFFGFWLLLSLVLNVVSAFCLRAKKARTFSIVVAAMNCLHMPLGTALGVFTIIVLVRDSVRELYET